MARFYGCDSDDQGKRVVSVATGCSDGAQISVEVTDELVAALAQLPAVQLRRLLMRAVAQLPVREIARREGAPSAP